MNLIIQHILYDAISFVYCIMVLDFKRRLVCRHCTRYIDVCEP